MRVLLIDQGADRTTPVAARALHRDGWIVGVGSPFRGLGQASRFVHRRHTIPAAETSAAELIDAVSTAVREEGYEVVFSPDDAGVLALSLYRDRVGAVVPWASHDVVLRALDKLELTRAADRVGLHTPYTIEGTDAAIREWKGAAIVKPRLHTTLLPGEPGRLGAVMVEDREAAARRCAELLAHRAQPIVQEIIGGTLMSLVLLADRGGRIVALVQQRSEHSYPRDIGVTARGHTIAVDRDLAIRAEALLRDLEWFGLAQLQFIEPLDGGPPRLMDLNGRFYGSLALALGGGVNLPALWARLATGRPVPEGVHEPSAGARFQWLSRDLRWAWQQAGVARFFGIADTLALAPRASHSVWQANDPWPAFSFLGGKLWRSVLHTGRRHDLVESIGGFKAVLAGFVEGEVVRKLIDTDEEFRGAICCLAHDVAPRRDDRSEGISLVVENAGLHHESLSAPEGGDRNPAGCKRAPYVDSGKRPIDVLWRKEEVGAGEQ